MLLHLFSKTHLDSGLFHFLLGFLSNGSVGAVDVSAVLCTSSGTCSLRVISLVICASTYSVSLHFPLLSCNFFLLYFDCYEICVSRIVLNIHVSMKLWICSFYLCIHLVGMIIYNTINSVGLLTPIDFDPKEAKNM